MNRFIVLCDCGREPVPAWWEPHDGRNVVAILDGMSVTPNRHRGTVGAGGWAGGATVAANRFGEHLEPLNLRCPGGCPPALSRIRESAIAEALTQIARRAEHRHLLVSPEMERLRELLDRFGEVVQFRESEAPATPADVELQRLELEADMFGQSYDGAHPKLVPVFVERRVIPWTLLTYTVTKMPRDRRK
ncbi:MAG: hypothetical protein QG671_1609 [Actinomycetota bacterium]|nr:hypothetical protein [Actinomycetota bacterium]